MAFFGIMVALGTALFDSAEALSVKSATKVFPNRRQLVLVQVCITALLLMCAWLVLVSIESRWIGQGGLREGFFSTLCICGTLNAVAVYFQVRALAQSDASLVGPIQLFTPVMLLFTSPLMVGQQIPPLGVWGVIIIVIGGYFLGCTKESLKSGEWVKPIQSLVFDKGARSMFITAFIWSITSNLDRIGVEKSGPLVWSLSVYCVMTVISFLFWYIMREDTVKLGVRTIRSAFIPGFAKAVGIVLQMYALTILPVPYVIALKRTSALMTVVLGGVFYKEKIGFRIVGVCIMLFGILLITFSL